MLDTNIALTELILWKGTCIALMDAVVEIGTC